MGPFIVKAHIKSHANFSEFEHHFQTSELVHLRKSVHLRFGHPMELRYPGDELSQFQSQFGVDCCVLYIVDCLKNKTKKKKKFEKIR